MNNKVDIINIRKKFLEKLQPSGWDEYLAPYINGFEFQIAINKLKEEKDAGRLFEPEFKNIFRAFELCPYKDFKVAMIGQDPYPQPGVADGISFSCSRKDKCEKSLQYIFRALYGDYKGKDNNLSRWSTQGVLMLNTALTVEQKKIGSHYNVWKPFIEYLFSGLNSIVKDRVFILLGKKAQEWESYLTNQHIISVSHPASAAYSGGEWNHKDVFNRTNEFLVNNNKKAIEW
mgnify:CR=1 FL=1